MRVSPEPIYFPEVKSQEARVHGALLNNCSTINKHRLHEYNSNSLQYIGRHETMKT